MVDQKLSTVENKQRNKQTNKQINKQTSKQTNKQTKTLPENASGSTLYLVKGKEASL